MKNIAILSRISFSPSLVLMNNNNQKNTFLNFESKNFFRFLQITGYYEQKQSDRYFQ